MKKTKKVLLVIALIIVIPVITVLIVRAVNSLRYPEPSPENLAFQVVPETLPAIDAMGEIRAVNHMRAQGYHMIPADKASKGLIVTFGGSEGGSNYNAAQRLYQQGYEVLSLYFFGYGDLPPILSRVDIGFFDDVLDYIEQNISAKGPLTVLGTSKGAELTLLLTQYYEEIDNVVLYTPSSCVFQGMDVSSRTGASSWMYQGQELPYCAFQNGSLKGMADMFGAMIFNYPISFRESYRSISQDITPESQQWIYKKPMKGNILAFAGTDDKMWPADQMGQALKDAHPEQVELHLYEGAGHIFIDATYGSGYALGGTVEANRQAREESNAVLAQRLEAWHR